MMPIRSATRSTSESMCELKNTVRPALDQMNDRLQKIAPHDGIEPERGIVEHEQIRIGRRARASETWARCPFERRRILAVGEMRK